MYRASSRFLITVLCGHLLFLFSQRLLAQPPSWTVEPANFQYNANVTAIFLLDDVVNEDTANVLGAFVGNEVRGVARIMFSGGGWRYFLTVYSNSLSGDTMKFQMYVASLDSILTIKEKIRFLSDSLYGDPITPRQLHASIVPEESSLQIQLQKGWNLVSVPYSVGSYSKTSLFPTSSSDAFAYANGYQSKTILQNGEGYWLKFDADSSGNTQTIQFHGYPRTADTIDVVSGWNIVGSISQPVVSFNVSSIGTTITSPFFGFTSGYQQADTIQPGKSYWVKVSQDGQIVLSSSTTAPQVSVQER
jgi:hypothetical protein